MWEEIFAGIAIKRYLSLVCLPMTFNFVSILDIRNSFYRAETTLLSALNYEPVLHEFVTIRDIFSLALPFLMHTKISDWLFIHP